MVYHLGQKGARCCPCLQINVVLMCCMGKLMMSEVYCCFAAGSAMRKWNVADPHFIGYTYKNWEAVHSGGEVPPELAAVQLKKKTPVRPSLQQLQSNLQAMGISSEQQQQQQ